MNMFLELFIFFNRQSFARKWKTCKPQNVLEALDFLHETIFISRPRNVEKSTSLQQMKPKSKRKKLMTICSSHHLFPVFQRYRY